MIFSCNFIEDAFNLYGLKQQFQNYGKLIDIILGKAPAKGMLMSNVPPPDLEFV